MKKSFFDLGKNVFVDKDYRVYELIILIDVVDNLVFLKLLNF